MNIEIEKVKVCQGNLVKVECSQSVERDGEVIKVGDLKFDGSYAASDSLVDAFKPLFFHFAILTEQIDESKTTKEDFDGVAEILDKHPVLKNIVCNQFRISGDTITLSGHRKTRYGKAVNMNAQLDNYDSGESEYEFGWELKECIDLVKREVVEYLYGKGKNIQLSLFADKALLVESE